MSMPSTYPSKSIIPTPFHSFSQRPSSPRVYPVKRAPRRFIGVRHRLPHLVRQHPATACQANTQNPLILSGRGLSPYTPQATFQGSGAVTLVALAALFLTGCCLCPVMRLLFPTPWQDGCGKPTQYHSHFSATSPALSHASATCQPSHSPLLCSPAPSLRLRAVMLFAFGQTPI